MTYQQLAKCEYTMEQSLAIVRNWERGEGSEPTFPLVTTWLNDGHVFGDSHQS